MVRLLPPLFVSITVLPPLTVPASCLPKLKLAGERSTFELADPEPEPASATGCVPGDASVATVRAPGTVPATVGWNVTLMMQLWPAASGEEQVLVGTLYPPLAVMPLMFKATV